MTSQKCFCRLNMFFETLKQSKYLMILHTIVLFLVSTLPAIIEVNNLRMRMEKEPLLNYSYAYNTISDFLSGQTIFIALVSVAICTISAIFIYNYLFKTTSVQFYSAMPIKRESMYISKFLSGMVSWIIPLVLICAVNAIIYFGYGLEEFFEISLIFKGFATALLSYFAMWSVAVFAVSVSGNFFAALIVIGVVFLIYPASTITVMGTVQSFFENISINFNYNVVYIFPPVLPALDDLYGISKMVTGDIIYTAVYSVVFFVLGLIFYKFRKNEHTSNFFAYKWIGIFFKYYATLLASLLFGALFFDISNNVFTAYIGYILIGFIVFIVLQAIFEKNFKSMFSNIKYFAIYMAIICIAVYYPITNREEISKKMPNPENIKTLEVNMSLDNLELSDPQNIAAALSLYESATQNQDTDKHFCWVSVEIKNNPLFSVHHSPNNWAAKEQINLFLERVYDTREYQDQKAKAIDNVTNIDFVQKIMTIYNDERVLSQKSRELLKIYKKDFINYSYSDIKDSGLYASIATDNGEFFVYNCYLDTVEYLKNNYDIEFSPDKVERIRVFTYRHDEEGKYSERDLYSTNIPSEMAEFLKSTSQVTKMYRDNIVVEIMEKGRTEPYTAELELYFLPKDIVSKLNLNNLY